jgi:hypothetical protein
MVRPSRSSDQEKEGEKWQGGVTSLLGARVDINEREAPFRGRGKSRFFCLYFHVTPESMQPSAHIAGYLNFWRCGVFIAWLFTPLKFFKFKNPKFYPYIPYIFSRLEIVFSYRRAAAKMSSKCFASAVKWALNVERDFTGDLKNWLTYFILGVDEMFLSFNVTHVVSKVFRWYTSPIFSY